jgi:hypothetical protein
LPSRTSSKLQTTIVLKEMEMTVEFLLILKLILLQLAVYWNCPQQSKRVLTQLLALPVHTRWRRLTPRLLRPVTAACDRCIGAL